MLDKEMILYLEKQKKNKYPFEDVDKVQLADTLLQHIGDLNPYIRDELVYPNLAHLFYDGHFSESELATYLHLLIGPEYLFFDIDNYIDMSVLVRSFSLIQISVLVAVHNRDNIISVRSLKSVLSMVDEYLEKETVFTGYDKSVGFIHTAAHAADVFARLMEVEDFGDTELKAMFTAISTCVKGVRVPLYHGEDGRFTKAIVGGLKRDILDKEYVVRWLDTFANITPPEKYPEKMYVVDNVKHTLQALYFELIDDKDLAFVNKKIMTILKNGFAK